MRLVFDLIVLLSSKNIFRHFLINLKGLNYMIPKPYLNTFINYTLSDTYCPLALPYTPAVINLKGKIFAFNWPSLLHYHTPDDMNHEMTTTQS